MALRTLSTLILLFVAESVPRFGSILGLVGGSTVTLLTFVFPPLFYMKLADASLTRKDWVQRFVLCYIINEDDPIFPLLRKLPMWERIYCWLLILIGIAGGCVATYQAFMAIISDSFTAPCYIDSNVGNIAGAH